MTQPDKTKMELFLNMHLRWHDDGLPSVKETNGKLVHRYFLHMAVVEDLEPVTLKWLNITFLWLEFNISLTRG